MFRKQNEHHKPEHEYSICLRALLALRITHEAKALATKVLLPFSDTLAKCSIVSIETISYNNDATSSYAADDEYNISKCAHFMLIRSELKLLILLIPSIF